MSESQRKHEANSPFWFGPKMVEFAQQIRRDGSFERLRASARGEGDPPWRIARYSRVIDPEKIAYPLPANGFVRPESFERQVAALKQHSKVVPLDSLIIDILERKPIEEGTVAISLDGGWIDNFVYATPILLKYGLPATVFLPTAYIGTNQYLWEDKFLLGMSALMKAGVKFTPFPFLPDEVKAHLELTSRNGEINLPTIFLLQSALLGCDQHVREAAIQRLGQTVFELGLGEPVDPAFSSWDDLRLMERSGKIQFGSLSHTHPVLSEVDEERAIAEIELSLYTLGSNFESPVPVFAFPYGHETENTLSALRRVGFTCALTLGAEEAPRPTRKGDLTLIPRVPIYEGCGHNEDLFFCRLWNMF